MGAPVRAVPVGPPMTPSVCYDLTHDGSEGWEGFRALLSHLGPDEGPWRQGPEHEEDTGADAAPIITLRMPTSSN